ncbi:MAG: regulatory iron-sulfur-containing complex subunit RicT [Ignavibacteria bacterium]
MYNIDLSFLKGNLVCPDKEDISVKYNDKYKNIIVNDYHSQYGIISGCRACEVEHFNKTPFDKRNIVEAESKGLLGNHFCLINESLINEIEQRDLIIVKNENDYEIARIVAKGEIVRIKRQKYGLFSEKLPQVIRKVTEEDSEKYRKNLLDEQRSKPIFCRLVCKLNLQMKLVDVHFQFDRKKLYFFYTADGRVDFRELAKSLATEFKTRIELRQIGVRDEAKRISGLGTCGREYCCSSFLGNFKRITTQIANEQNLSSNISKLSGPCGKLKCCLSFELEEN